MTVTNRLPTVKASIAQHAIWLSSKKYSSKANCVPILWTVNGLLNDKLLEQALMSLILKHTSLRLGFRFDDNLVYQFEKSIETSPFQSFDVQQCDLESAKQKASFFEFDMEQPPLLKLTKINVDGADCVLVFCFHHIVCDAISLKLYVGDFCDFYETLVKGLQPTLVVPKFDYLDYAKWENSSQIEAKKKNNIEKWKNTLRGFRNVSLFSKLKTTAVRGKKSETFPFINYTSDALVNISTQFRTTKFIYFASTIALLLHKYSQERKLLLYFPVSIRDEESMLNIGGPFVNTLALAIEVDKSSSFFHVLDQVKKSLLFALNTKLVPLESVYQKVKEYYDRETLSVLFMYNYSGGIELSIEGCTAKQIDCYSSSPKFDLVFDFIERKQNINASLEYDTAIFDRFAADSIAQSLNDIIDQTLANPNISLSQIQFSKLSHLPLVEQHAFEVTTAITKIFNNLHTLRQDNTPLVTSTQCSYTAEGILEKVNTLQQQLTNSKIRSGNYVLVCLDRRVEIVPVILSIMGLGAIYVPLGQKILASHLEHIVKQTQSRIVICDASTVHLFSDIECTLNIDEVESKAPSNPALSALPIQPDYVAYCFFTSGTTGVPKGVKITHKNLTSFIHAMENVIRLNRQDVMGSLTSFNFDISLLELLLPLHGESKVHVFTEDQKRSSSELSHTIQQYDVTVIQATPTYWNLIDLSPTNCSLRIAISGGEAISAEVVKKMNAIAQKSFNCYGPTEATIWATSLDCTNWDRDSISVGSPLTNTGVVILGEDFEVLPHGVIGEICLYGQCVGDGYLKNKEQTEKAFIYSEALAAKLYRTGDLGQLNADNEVDILGRCDNQVKINGHRVELEDIESSIRNHPDVYEVVATINNTELQAAIVCNPQTSLSDLTRFIKINYPQHYSPKRWLLAESLPILSSGKLDRKTIAALDHEGINEKQEEIQSYQLHEVLRDFIESVDTLDSAAEIDIDADLTQLGFDSVLYIILTERIKTELGKILDFNDLISGITLRELSLKVS